ncbi:CTD kinase subunit gamma [Cordyceps militaris CM01]|uniref:CTD kinase subunit gamma n=2 Tax=Cordyceps militaris TaxID=73501 RepID=G3J5K0_CORMM|nr:CTD kinase subunit gamma [Cordyceps militaris CM01]EGX96856.1 CTD kinase subunit gamma [Cordyceps militaris CM01]
MCTWSASLLGQSDEIMGEACAEPSLTNDGGGGGYDDGDKVMVKIHCRQQQQLARAATAPDSANCFVHSSNNVGTTVPSRSIKKMADPFEVRMRFSSQLQHLNASVASAQKAAQYALKYKEWHEDLHSCILEQVERTNMNTRANIMYFIEHFLDQASREGQPDYIQMMQRDIIRVVDAVAPDDGSGAANVKVVRKVLQGLQGRGFLDSQVATQIIDVIKERGTKDHDLGLSSPMESVTMAEQTPAQPQGQPAKRIVPTRLDKRQVEQRIEEDRERHKRERESIWAVPKGDGAEMDKLWEETSDFGEDDDRLITEENADFDTEMEMQLCSHQRAANGDHR